MFKEHFLASYSILMTLVAAGVGMFLVGRHDDDAGWGIIIACCSALAISFFWAAGLQ